MAWKTTVLIPIGNGFSFAVQEELVPFSLAPKLFILDPEGVAILNLGHFTKARIEELQAHLERLKIHAQ